MTGQLPPNARDSVGGSPGPGGGRKGPVKQVVLGNGETVVLAGYGQRFRARIADSLLLGIGLAIVSIVWVWMNLDYFLADFNLPGVPPEPRNTARLILSGGMFIPLLLYEIVAVAWRGRTLGMRIEDILVVSVATGRNPSVVASFWRWALQIAVALFSFPLDAWLFIFGGVLWWLLVHLSVFWGRDRRGWHDLLAGTVVVTSVPPEPVGDTV